MFRHVVYLCLSLLLLLSLVSCQEKTEPSPQTPTQSPYLAIDFTLHPDNPRATASWQQSSLASQTLQDATNAASDIPLNSTPLAVTNVVQGNKRYISATFEFSNNSQADLANLYFIARDDNNDGKPFSSVKNFVGNVVPIPSSMRIAHARRYNVSNGTMEQSPFSDYVTGLDIANSNLTNKTGLLTAGFLAKDAQHTNERIAQGAKGTVTFSVELDNVADANNDPFSFKLLVYMATDVTSASDIFARNRQLGKTMNLGNALEAPNEGDWGITLQSDYFAKIAAKGFDSVRVPMRFSNHALHNAPYTINASFFSRVDWVLQQAKQHNLNVVINIHHYDEISRDPNGHKARFLALWQQISDRYKNEGDYLFFEVMNEPTHQFNSNPALWNSFFAEALQIIRSTNPTRAVIVGPVFWNSLTRLKDLVLPNDPYLIVTIHFYEPFAFTHQGATWVNPVPATGVTWTGTRGSLAWENRSWDTTLNFQPQALQVTYTRGWAGLFLYNSQLQSNYREIHFEVDSAHKLAVKCGDSATLPSAAKVIDTTAGWNHYSATLSECGANNNQLRSIAIMNFTAQPQSAFLLRNFKVCEANQTNCLTLISNEAQAIEQRLDEVKAWSVANNRPIFIGEFGAYEKADMASRIRWTKKVRESAEARGFSWAYWEFASGFGVYNPNTNQWRDNLLKALIP